MYIKYTKNQLVFQYDKSIILFQLLTSLFIDNNQHLFSECAYIYESHPGYMRNWIILDLYVIII